MPLIDEISDGNINLGNLVTLPTVKTEITLSDKTIAVVVGLLAVIAIFVFKPFK